MAPLPSSCWTSTGCSTPSPLPPAPTATAGTPSSPRTTGDRPAAWVDDAHTEAGAAWARSRTAPTLLLPSDPARGLTADMVTALHAWRAAL